MTDSATNLLVMSNRAHLTSGGVWANVSGRNSKAGFTEVDDKVVLAKIATLPTTYWSYKNKSRDVIHNGPTAQNFAAAFKLGSDDKNITTVDADGHL